MDENFERRQEEIEVLQSIYEDLKYDTENMMGTIELHTSVDNEVSIDSKEIYGHLANYKYGCMNFQKRILLNCIL